MPTNSLTIIDATSPQPTPDADLKIADVIVHARADERTPLIAIHTWAGETKKYKDLTRALGPERALYSVLPPRFESLEAYPKTTHEWVEFILPRIEAIAPSGELILVGWSFGGVMALEVAESLVRSGRSVSQVIMIDTRLPKYRPETKPGVKMPVRLRRFAKHLHEYSEIEERGDRLRYAAHRLDPFRRLRKDRARKQRRTQSQEKVQSGRQRERSRKTPHSANQVVTRYTGESMSFLKRTIHVAYLKYIRHHTQIPLHLLRTQESFKKAGNDPSLGWAPFALGRFVMDSIEGEHDTLFEPAHILGLARHIQAALNNDGGPDTGLLRESKTTGTERRPPQNLPPSGL